MLGLLAVAATVIGACQFMYTVSAAAAVSSPDGKLVADWYQLGGGGAAGWSIDRIRLRRAGDPSNLRWPSAMLRDYSVGIISGDRLNIRWTSNNELRVDYPTLSTVTRCEPQWREVSIRCHEDPQMKR